MKIFVEFDMDAEKYTIMAGCGRMSPMPAGPRLFRGGTPPSIEFTHSNIDSAEIAAKSLRSYLGSLPPKKTTK